MVYVPLRHLFRVPMQGTTPTNSPASPASLACDSPDFLDSLSPPPISLSPQALGNSSSEHGLLHLYTSSLDAFLELPNRREDRYQLIDGILYHIPVMSDNEHRDIQVLLFCHVIRLNIESPREKWVSVFEEAYIARIGPDGSLKKRKKVASCFVADVAIGEYMTPRRGRLLPEMYRKIRFPPGKIPYLVIKVTSTNRTDDTFSKMVEYGHLKVPQYIIVDRKEQCVKVYYLTCPPLLKQDEQVNLDAGREMNRTPRRSSRLKNALPPSGCELYKYSYEFRGSEVVRPTYLETMKLTANDLLKPKSSPTEILDRPVRQMERVAEEAILAGQKKDRRIATLEAALHQNGCAIPTESEDSSSGQSSDDHSDRSGHASTSSGTQNASSARNANRAAIRDAIRGVAHSGNRKTIRGVVRNSGRSSDQSAGRSSGRSANQDQKNGINHRTNGTLANNDHSGDRHLRGRVEPQKSDSSPQRQRRRR